MATVGIKMVTLALVDDNQKLIKGEDGLSASGLVQIDDSMLGTKTANISNLEGSVTKIPGNNKIQESYTNPSAPQVALDFNNLAFDIKQKAKGMKSDGKGGWVYSGKKPRVAMLLESETLDRKHSIYTGFGDGIMQEMTANHGTDTDTAQTRANDILTYIANSTVAFNNQPYKVYFSGDEHFDKANMLKEVFGGYATSVAEHQ